ncbi:hypothetical protein DFJ58DRAFT_718750 [Suillus subalutaceus]|uniref:uncharacterized protein n=1 Tax=Suillus subalutaceus TaxID=48586 RepID=UPI001B86A5C3|nr:uncharacterized protein DFJ58DRAFT_718750 [Suillus subalutaceus]KAG1838385.1 hypothetical protein DFJ58DRAFT_718750 [Suillus subalutaceus]
MYLSLQLASQEAYNHIRRATIRNYAHDDEDSILSFYNVEKLVAQYTGVESIEHDMCPDSCLAFTGPYAALEICPLCDKSRWDQGKLRATNDRSKVAAQKFTTIPLGPQLQAMYRDPDSARHMQYLHEHTQQILAQLRATQSIPVIDDIAAGWDYLAAVLANDIKQDDIVLMVPDCWMYVWIILNLSPDKRYQKVHISFLFVGMHHLAALQKNGLTIWDASRDTVFTSDLHLLFTTADGPGLVYWDGMVGHSGKNGCQGRRKTGGSHYYPALLRPADRCARALHSPSVFLTLAILATFSSDCAAADNPATWDWAVLKDEDTWIAHGEAVEKAGVYLPGSFDRKPRNIAEKLNTSYKTWEFQLYMFGLAPALLYGLLPMKYWQNYCKLVARIPATVPSTCSITAMLLGTRIRAPLLSTQRVSAPFVRPCKGPPICYAQWTMERTIGNLGQEIRQPSQPYANLSQQGVRRYEPPKGLPEGAVDVGDGYVLLRNERAFLRHGQQLPRIRKWARLRLPNGQTARSSWREKLKPLEKTRMSRNVKIKLNNKIQFAEVLYYTQLPVNVAGQNADNSDDDNEWHFENVAVVQMYSMPHKELLKLSLQTLVSCTLLDDILAIDVKNIVSVYRNGPA